jgi:FkbM family methyltransferase
MKASSTGSVAGALATIGRNEQTRERLIGALLGLEPALAQDGLNVREEVTGPIVDALFAEGEIVHRTLSTGLQFAFPYRSKIARDFVMAGPSTDHVWEPQTTKLLLMLGSGAKQVIVGGAYFGDQAIPLANVLRGSGGICHCFDVNEEQLRTLADNVTRNGLEKHLRINRFALWERDGRRVVMVGDDSHAYSKEIDDPRAGCETVRIDTYAAQQGFDRIDLIMLDIEGAELGALRGAERFLRQSPTDAPSIMFEVHRSYVDWSRGLNNAEIVSFLTGHGYRVFAVRDYQSNVDMAGRPVELVPTDDIYLDGPPHGFNMLAVKNEELLSRHGMRVVAGVSPKLLFHRDSRLHQPRS